MATFTASVLFSPLKAVHTGVNFSGGAISICGTATASSIIKLAQVPNQALVVDWWLHCEQAGANQSVQIGFSNTASVLMAAQGTTASSHYFRAAIAAYTGSGIPWKVSLSDDMVPPWIWAELKFTAAISASALVKFGMFYLMDGTPGWGEVP